MIHLRLACTFVPIVALSAALPACTTTSAGAPLVAGGQAAIEGDVVRVDTVPWTYDGNAVVTVSTGAHGTLNVQLPARWNLCKAPPLDDVQALKPRDRVKVVGTMVAPGEIVVCEQTTHRLYKVE